MGVFNSFYFCFNEPKTIDAASAADGAPPSGPTVLWKFSNDKVQARRFKELERIKDAACLELQVPKCRVALVDSTRLWIPTATGAFCAALAFDTFFLANYEAFLDNPASGGLFVAEDCSKDPRFAAHPGVVNRPHLRFYVGAPLVSRGNHCMGLLYAYDTQPREDLNYESEQRVLGLAQQTVAALQADMFSALGDDASAPLPAVWFDATDPNWRVIGANEQWGALTGVGVAALRVESGLLAVLTPADGTELEALRDALAAAVYTRNPSFPAILSPRDPAGASLQYVCALRRAAESGDIGPPPAPEVKPAGELWIAEVHARVQADTTPPWKPFHSRSISGRSTGAATSHDFNSRQSSNSTLVHFTPGRDFRQYSSDRGGGHASGGAGGGASGGALISGGGSSGASLGGHGIPVPPRLASLQLGPLLGQGSYGSVYYGMLQDRPVAVKVMQQAPGPEAARKQWEASYEAMVTSDLRHPHLVPALDWCSHISPSGGLVWIVQELCDLGSLSAGLGKGLLREHNDPEGAPDMRGVLETAREVAAGMQYLHSCDVLHADLSSNNIMLVSAPNRRGFIAKCTDFGLSRVSGRAEDMTRSVGTVSHMAPELLMEGVSSKAGDVYSFGVLLWELYTGKRAWSGSSQAQVIFSVTCKGGTLQMPEDAPPAYAALVKACIDPDSERRPIFEEVLRRIDEILADMPPAEENEAMEWFYSI